MAGNTFGSIFKLTTFGESHGPALGGVVDGCPAGIALSEASIQTELDKRRPGQGGPAVTARSEPDRIRLLSGVFEGRSTGTSIGFIIENTDQRSHDYGEIKDVFRPGHGDMTYQAKYGLRDYRGGGRSSGRETVSRVAGGAVAAAFLQTLGITVRAAAVELGGIACQSVDLEGAEHRPFFAAEDDAVLRWQERVKDVAAQGDTLGGIVEIRACGVPVGLGEPVFDKLDARLAAALMSVGAVKGVEIGGGFAASRMLGSENNDAMLDSGFASNNAGGILAGISSGQEIVLRAAIKPIPSIALEQRTLDRFGTARTIRVGGRHDICAIPRVVPVLCAMAKLVLADMVLLQRRMGVGT
ncbi:chorismate synthase [Desulfomicrobium baculatum]|uniref:Chorismate synthase n=1 Tax=Desulfomicrobium baculatum (strain DSM 4028 / VKM B-1378 / X) TaxID=525897 RepID=C7LUN7_DESBD|nr:chorismate synthase [Desulfomicrobium baculatum]ACU90952.1 chorismate synthase [Desulfomicrobium baculatum DSM 4028]